MSGPSQSGGPSGLRRAWLRELGVEHVWTLPAPPPLSAAQDHVPAAETAADVPEAAANVPAAAGATVPAPVPAAAPAPATAPATEKAEADPATPLATVAPPKVQPEPAAADVSPDPPVSSVEQEASTPPASADVFRREPIPDPFRTPPQAAAESAGGASPAAAQAYSREPVADVYRREPYVDPALADAPAVAEDETSPDDSPSWVAVTAPAATPDQEDWLLVGEGLDTDLAAPARHRFLTALLAAQGHVLGEVRPWPHAAEEGAAALIVIGASAIEALAAGGEPYAVGEIAVDGVPLPALLLPALPQASLNAEGKAATWRGLLRLSAHVNGIPD